MRSGFLVVALFVMVMGCKDDQKTTSGKSDKSKAAVHNPSGVAATTSGEAAKPTPATQGDNPTAAPAAEKPTSASKPELKVPEKPHTGFATYTPEDLAAYTADLGKDGKLMAIIETNHGTLNCELFEFPIVSN